MRPSKKLFLPLLFFIASIAISFSFESLVNFVNPITVVAYSANSCTGQILISSVQGGSGPVGDGYDYQWYKQNPTNPAVYTELEGQITRRLNVAGYGVPGVFKVRITDPEGNFIEPEYPISEPFPLVGQTIFSGLVCSDDPNSGTLIFLFQNGSDPYTWTLTKTPSGPSRTGTLTGSETLIVNALTAGTYNLTWSDKDGCTGQKEIIIASATPITTQVNQTNVTCPGGSNGTATFNLSGGWGTPYAIKIVRVVGSGETTVLNWTNLGTATTYTANGLPAGTYKVYYYDRIKNAPISTTYGYNVISPLLYPICAKFQTFTITEPAPFSVPVTQSAAVCQGDTNGFLTLVPTGGSPPYQITFYSGHFANTLAPVINGGMTDIGQQTGVTSGQTVTKNGLAAGQYAIQLIDVNNCIYSGNFTILENPKGQVNATADNAYCAGSPITAAFSTTNVGGTTTYSWTNSNPAIGLAATGTGNISFTSTNTTNVPIQGTVTVTPTYTANGVSCPGPADTFILTVNPKPVIQNYTPAICSGTAFTVSPANAGATIVPANTTYTWTISTNNSVTGQSAQPTGQNSISQTLTNISNTVQTVTYTVTPTSGAAGNCVGANFQVVVTVNPKPRVADQTIEACSRAPISYTATHDTSLAPNGNIVPANTQYTWTIKTDNNLITGKSAQATAQATFTQTLRNTTNSQETIVYTLTPISGTCPGAPFDLTVLVNPTPEIAAKTAEICSSGTFTVSPTNTVSSGVGDIVPAGTTYTWTVVDNGSVTGETANSTAAANISQQLINTSNLVQTVTYTVTPRSGATGNCVGANFQVVITVNPKPRVANQTIDACSKALITYTATHDATLAPNGNIVPTNTLYTWIIKTNNDDITGKEAQNTPQTSFTQTLRNTTNTQQTIVYTLTPISGTCPGTPFDLTVLVNPTPEIANETIAACSNAPITYTATNGGGIGNNNIVPTNTLYTWTIKTDNANITGKSAQATAQSTFTQTLRNTTNTPKDIVYTLIPKSGTCTGTPFDLTVTVNPTPEIQAYAPVICSGDPFTVSPANAGVTIVPANTTYTWTVAPNGSISDESGQSNPQTSISQTLTNSTNTVQTVTYTVTPKSGLAGACVGATFQIVVTVNPKPSVNTAQSRVVCSNSTLSYSVTNGGGNIIPANTRYTWTIQSDNSDISGQTEEPISRTNFTQTLKNKTIDPQTIVYSITPVSNNGVCIGAPYLLTVQVNPTPEIAAKTAVICSEGTFTVSPVDAVVVNGVRDIVPANTTYIWTVVDNPLVTGEAEETNFQANISQALTNTSNTVQTVVYTVTPRSGATGNCFGLVEFQVSVQVNPKPFVQPIAQTFCSGSQFTITPANGSGNIVPTGTTYSWTFVDNTSVTGEANGTNQANLTQNLTNLTTTPQVVTYTVTPTSGAAGNCVGSTFTATITVNPTIQITNKTPAAICSRSSFTVQPIDGVDGDFVPNGMLYTWTVAPNANIEGASNQTTPQASISQPLRNKTNSPETVVYTVTPIYGASCSGGTFSITVTVNPTPEIAPKPRIICSGDPFTVTPTNTVVNGVGDIVPANTTYTWTVAANANVTGQSDQTTGQPTISQTLTNISNTVQTVTYTVTPRSGATGNCVGTTFQIAVTVNPRPLVANQTIVACSRAPITYTATQGGVNGNIVPAGTQYTWTIKTDNNQITGQDVSTTAQASFTQILRNTTNTQQTIVYTLTPSIGACVGTAFDLTVNVYPTPEIAAKTDAICSGGTFTVSPANAGNGVLDIVPAGTTYTWTVATNNNVNGESSEVIEKPSISQQLTNLTNVPQTVIYTVTPRSVVWINCTGQPFQVSVQVNPKPFVLPIPETVCSASPFTITPLDGNGNIVPTGTTYSWTFADNASVTGEAIGTAQTNFTQTLTNTTTAPQQVVYTVTPTSGDAGNCVGSPFTVTITVNPTPVIANITDTICSNTSFTVTPQNGSGNIVPIGTTYIWTVTPNANVEGESNQTTAQNNISQPLRNTTNTVQTVVYQVTPRLGTCAGTPFRVTITVNPTPEIAAKTRIICSGDPFTVTPTNTVVNGIGDIVPDNTTYTWTVIDNNNISGDIAQSNPQNSISQTLTNTSNTAQTVTYTVTPTSGTCVGQTFQILVTVNSRPSIVSETIAACSNAPITYTATQGSNGNIVPANTQYTWTIKTDNSNITGQSVQTTAQASFTQTLRNTTNTQKTIVYTLTPSIGTCVGTAFDLTVQVNPTPEIAAKTVAICSEVFFTVSPVDGFLNGNGAVDIVPTGTIYTWVVTPNNNVTGESSESIPQNFSGSQQLINTTNTVQTVVYAVTPRSGATGNCIGQPFQVSVQVNPKPFVQPIPETVCSASPFTITPTNGNNNIVPTGTTYSWTFADNASVTGEAIGTAQANFNQTLTNTTTTPQQVIYTVTPTSGDTGNCVGSPFTVTITVNPTPVIANITDTICSNTSFTVTPQNGSGNIVPTGTTYIWTVTPNANVEGESNQTTAQNNISQPLRNTTNTVQTVEYQVTPRLGTCPGTPFRVTVTVYPTPEIDNTTAIICSGDPFSISPTNTVVNGVGNIVPANTTYTWTVAANANVTGQSDQGTGQTSISQTLTNTSNTVQTVTYTVTPRSGEVGNCVGQTFQVLVTVNPRPRVANQTIETCSNAQINYTATNGGTNNNIVPANTQYTWIIKTDNNRITGQSVQSTAQANFAQTLRNTTNTQETIVYTLTPRIGTCVGTAFDLTVLVNPTPEIAAKTTAICSEGTFTVSPANAGNGALDIVPAGTTYTWIVNPNNNVTGETSVSTAQTSISQALTNTTNQVQTVIYTVTPKSGVTGNCIGQTFQVSVQVNPKPFVQTINEIVCSASPFTITPLNGNGNIVPTGTTYTWTFVDNANVTGEANGTAQTNFTQTLTNTTTIPQVVTYTVTPTSGDAGNCVGNPFTINITVNPTPVISAKQLLICSGDTFNFTLTDGANGDKIPVGTKYTWTVIPNPQITGAVNQSTPQNSILVTQALVNTGTAVETITYQVTPTSATGCSGVSFNLVVTVKPPIVINGEPFSYNGFGISCFGANDGFINLNPTGGKLPGDPAGYTYSWTGPNGFTSTDQNIDELVPGTYTVTVGEASGICTQTKTFVVTEPQPVVITETLSNYNGFEISCFGASDGNINLSVTGGTSSYTYLWTASLGGLVPAGMETAANLTGVRAGTYSVKVLDSNGCEKIETYELRQPAPVAISEVVLNRRNILCYGEATGNITVLGSGGIKQYTFTVTGTDYTGAAVSLTSGPTNLNLFSFSTLKAGTYVLTLTDLNGCQKSVAPITLTQPLAPLQISNEVLSNYNGFNIACFGDTNGSISHQVSGGTPFGGTAPYRYAWTGPNGFSSTSLNLTNLAAGSYTLTITDAVNCTLVKTYVLREPDPIKVDAVKQNVLCGGELSGNIFIRNVTGGTGTYQFLWLKDGVGEIKRSFLPEDLRNIGPGRYILLITDQNFCEYIEVFDVTEPVPLVTTLVKKENNLCFGESKGSIQINVAGGTAPYRYAWTGPAGYTSTNKDLTGLLSGTYQVAVTDALLCTSTLSVTITQPTEIIVTPTLTMVSCPDGKDGAISMTVSGGIPPYLYTWTGPSGFRSTTKDLSNLSAGTYDLVITDGIGCKITRTFKITAPDPIVITPTISNYNGFQISCKGGSDGVIDLKITGGNGDFKYFWEGPGGFRSNLPKIEKLVPGKYEVTVIDSKNCIAKASYELVAPEELLITKDDVKITDVSCFDGRDGTLTVTIKKASVGPYRYELSGTSVTGFPVLESILSPNLNYQFTDLRAGSYTLRVSDANGCALSELSGLVVTQPSAALGFTILKTDNLCYRANNGTIRITPTGGTAPYTILWSNLSQAFTQQNLAPGIYTATLTDAKGCTIAINTEIKEAPIYDLTETVKNVSCFGKKDGSIQLNIIGGKAPLKIEWAHGPQEPTLNNLDKGVYSVVITDAGGCKIERQFVINEPQPLDLSATVTDALDCVDPNSGSINITPFGGTPPYTYNWSNGSKTQNLSAISPGSYSLELLDKNGCRILKQFTVIRPIPLEVSVAQTTERICNPRGLKSNFKVTVKGGIAPYTVTWNRGTATNGGLVMDTQEVGVFIVTVKDARGCIQTKRMEVVETDPLIPEFDYTSASYDLTFENLVNFEVQFKNLSIGKYKEASWDFGDGGSSLDKDPKKKYSKAGTYIVQLKLKDLDGCVVTFSKEIVITDYYLEFPNVFTPNDDSVNDNFYPKFIFIKDIHVTIINKWGELVYESKDLDALGWDGLHNGERSPIGNYVCRVRHTTLDGRKIDQSSVFYLGR